MTRDEVLVLLAYLAECYPRSNSGDPMARSAVWHDMFRRYEADGIMTAARQVALNSNTYPTPSVILSTYQAHRRLQAVNEVPAIEVGDIPTFNEGMAFAMKAYAYECGRLGKEPNWALFRGYVDKIPQQQAE